MDDLERISDERDCKYVDLYVRKQNQQAIRFYKKLGYYVYETVKDYYTSYDDDNVTEDAYDMHKLLHKWEEKSSKTKSKKQPSSSGDSRHVEDGPPPPSTEIIEIDC